MTDAATMVRVNLLLWVHINVVIPVEEVAEKDKRDAFMIVVSDRRNDQAQGSEVRRVPYISIPG